MNFHLTIKLVDMDQTSASNIEKGLLRNRNTNSMPFESGLVFFPLIDF